MGSRFIHGLFPLISPENPYKYEHYSTMTKQYNVTFFETDTSYIFVLFIGKLIYLYV